MASEPSPKIAPGEGRPIPYFGSVDRTGYRDRMWCAMRAPSSPEAKQIWAALAAGPSANLSCAACPGATDCVHLAVVQDALSWLERQRTAPSPAWEGVSHINAYSQSKTEAGRILSNFAHTPFTLEKDGRFASVEAYWYWLSSPTGEREALRDLYGVEAKSQGRILRGRDWPTVPGFERRVCQAILAKVRATPQIGALLQASGALPITHYFVRGGVVSTVQDGGWMWRLYEEVRANGVDAVKLEETPVGAQAQLFVGGLGALRSPQG